MPCALTPACRMNIRRVGIHPEVMAIRVAIKMEPQSVATHLSKRGETKVIKSYTHKHIIITNINYKTCDGFIVYQYILYVQLIMIMITNMERPVFQIPLSQF